jgi:hypothetical protein
VVMCDELLGVAIILTWGERREPFFIAPGLIKIATRLPVCIINKKVIRERNVPTLAVKSLRFPA